MDKDKKPTPGARRAVRGLSAHGVIENLVDSEVDEIATLIDEETSAPELLAALENLVSQKIPDYVFTAPLNQAIDQAIAAIRKALID